MPALKVSVTWKVARFSIAFLAQTTGFTRSCAMAALEASADVFGFIASWGRVPNQILTNTMTEAAIAAGPYLTKSRRALIFGLIIGNTSTGGGGPCFSLRTCSTLGVMAFREKQGSAISAARAGSHASAVMGTPRLGAQ